MSILTIHRSVIGYKLASRLGRKSLKLPVFDPYLVADTRRISRPHKREAMSNETPPEVVICGPSDVKIWENGRLLTYEEVAEALEKGRLSLSPFTEQDAVSSSQESIMESA